MIDSSAIRDITANIWESMLSLPIEDGPGADVSDYITGCVQITGDWQAAVTVELSAELARRAAAALFAMEPEEVGEGEINDAVGELANMVGGNIKSLVPGTSQLSLPAVVGGRHYTLSVSRGELAGQIELSSEGQPIEVRVFERRDD